MSFWVCRVTCDLEEENLYFYRFTVYYIIVSYYLELLEVVQILTVFAQPFIFFASNIINIGWGRRAEEI